MNTDNDTSITKSSGNIFADLGLEDSDDLQVKADLIASIYRIMKKHRLTQEDVAVICHVDQPTISKLLRGKVKSITIDRLTLWITLLGSDVEIKVKDKKTFNGKPGHLRVSAAIQA